MSTIHPNHPAGVFSGVWCPCRRRHASHRSHVSHTSHAPAPAARTWGMGPMGRIGRMGPMELRAVQKRPNAKNQRMRGWQRPGRAGGDSVRFVRPGPGGSRACFPSTGTSHNGRHARSYRRRRQKRRERHKPSLAGRIACLTFGTGTIACVTFPRQSTIPAVEERRFPNPPSNLFYLNAEGRFSHKSFWQNVRSERNACG
jgi:hypothetical protein